MVVSIGSHRRAMYGLLIVLVVFLVIADVLVISQIYRNEARQIREHTSSESILFASLVGDALTRGDYASVEQMARNWATDTACVSRVAITTRNGFLLAGYTRPRPAERFMTFREQIEYGADRSARMELDMDVSENYAYVRQIIVQIVLFSIVLIALLGYFIKRVALQPLEDEIEQHRRTERSLEKYTQALAISNRDLEAFSYSAAHDLRQPLRAITSFSQLIREEASQKLNDEENDYLNRVIRAGERLAQLLDDLLALARVSRAEMEVSSVDLGRLANDYLEQRRKADPERRITWQVAENLVVRGDPGLLALALDNLLGNAWKYTEKTQAAHIEFGVTRQDGGPNVYYVKDNGIGFDMQYADKLFMAFQRLHGSDEFEGTGIGLASVKQIIQRHGGEIWVDSRPGKGATFFFTVPSPRG